MAEIKPRYEFRIWGRSLVALRDKLNELAEPRETVSEETYLISPMTEGVNVKIRAGLMDIKVLLAEDRGLQQWTPTLKEEFPLSAATIAEKVYPALQVTAPSLAKAAYTLDEFLNEVVRPQKKVAIVDVTKTRYQYGIGTCAAEYSKVTLKKVPRDTVAVESTDPDAVLQLVEKLGIGEKNVSYISEISRILRQADGS